MPLQARGYTMIRNVIPSGQGEKGVEPTMNTTTTTLKNKYLFENGWVIYLKKISLNDWSFYVSTCPVYEGIDKANRALNAACDGAVKMDGVGFNKADTNIGSRVARNGIARAGEVKALMWARCLLKYRNQLAGYGINYPDILFEGE